LIVSSPLSGLPKSFLASAVFYLYALQSHVPKFFLGCDQDYISFQGIAPDPVLARKKISSEGLVKISGNHAADIFTLVFNLILWLKALNIITSASTPHGTPLLGSCKTEMIIGKGALR
jgi:hypothetical protein